MSSILAVSDAEVRALAFTPGETLLAVLRRADAAPEAPCGGRGTCKKCLVTVAFGGKTEEVLACRTLAADGMRVLLKEARAASILSDAPFPEGGFAADGEGYGLAVDLGTTTVAARLVRLSDGKNVGVLGERNTQRAYGADVITRTQYTMEHPEGLALLSRLIREQVARMEKELLAGCGLPEETPVRLFVAGNTVMQHLFAGLSPASIATAPFLPQTLFEDGKAGGLPFGFAPCVSGYIGGDITAGLLAAGLDRAPGSTLFIDLGTNGEMALGGRDGIVCCSVASGPAFEGAGISCGMPGLAGAVSHVRLKGKGLALETIGGAPPAGICGSGIIDLAACLLELGILDESGYLQPPDELDEDFGPMLGTDADGNGIVYLAADKSVFFTARDVRQLQLAKAAVAAGIGILLEEAGIGASALSCVYLAGGFGTFISVESAVKTGMLPKEAASVTKSIGNSSLAGATAALVSVEAARALYRIPRMCRYIELSGDKRFNDRFADHMEFYSE